jgi:hypothetical protein
MDAAGDSHVSITMAPATFRFRALREIESRMRTKEGFVQSKVL